LLRSEPKADLVIINGAEPGSLDPATSKGVEELRIVMALFEGLMRADPKDGGPVPGIAERCDRSSDGKVHVLFAHQRALVHRRTHHGARLHLFPAARARSRHRQRVRRAVVLHQERRSLLQTRTQNPAQVGIKAIDDLTFRVELANPTPFFLYLCAFQTLAVVPRAAIEKQRDRLRRTPPRPVSGPYKLESRRRNHRVRLRANPRYWDFTNTHCQIVDLLPIRGASTAFNLYQRGAVDIIWDKERIPSELFPILRGRPDFRSFNYLGTYFLRFNTTRPPLNDPRVRRALAMTIDKPHLVDKILKTSETPPSNLFRLVRTTAVASKVCVTIPKRRVVS
jgi:oligopeptide transport system substrate-binding protein